MKDGKRTFTVTKVKSNNKTRHDIGGVYTSSTTPATAARKAGSMICRKTKGRCSLEITIKETTQGSLKKEYTYKYQRIKLKEPVEARAGILVNYTSKIKAVKI